MSNTPRMDAAAKDGRYIDEGRALERELAAVNGQQFEYRFTIDRLRSDIEKAKAEKQQALAECEKMRKIILDAELMSETVLDYTLTIAKEEK